jgi:3-dehydroquinate synthetase
VLKRLQADKKTKDGVVHFVLPREVGQVEIVKGVPENIVLEAMAELENLSGRN